MVNLSLATFYFFSKEDTGGQGVDKTSKRLLSVEETAAYIGLSPRTIYNGVAPRAKAPFPIKPKRIGKLIRFDIKDLDRYVDSL
jgi:predicted DNA-binding transcriptional regulator AlpA